MVSGRQANIFPGLLDTALKTSRECFVVAAYVPIINPGTKNAFDQYNCYFPEDSMDIIFVETVSATTYSVNGKNNTIIVYIVGRSPFDYHPRAKTSGRKLLSNWRRTKSFSYKRGGFPARPRHDDRGGGIKRAQKKICSSGAPYERLLPVKLSESCQ